MAVHHETDKTPCKTVRQRDEPARLATAHARELCRSSIEAGAVEVFMNNAGELDLSFNALLVSLRGVEQPGSSLGS